MTIKADRMATLSQLWDQAAAKLIADEQAQKNNYRRVKELQTRIQSTNKAELLVQYYRRCQRRYYRMIDSYVYSNDIYRTSMKAFVFTTRKPEEGCAPEFRYLPSSDDMQKLVQASVGIVDL